MSDMIELREFAPEDVADHVAGEDDEIVRWLNEGQASTAESTARWIARGLQVHRGCAAGEHVFAIALDGRLAGMVALDPGVFEGALPGDVNVSYAVQPWARGRGVATEAVLRAASVASERRLGTHLLLRIDPGNAPSSGVARKVGARPAGEVLAARGVRLMLWRLPLS